MALFGSRKTKIVEQPPPPAWTPTVNVDTARPAVFALANAPASNDPQNRAAIAAWCSLSNAPRTPEEFVRVVGSNRNVMERVWYWLRAVSQSASESGDHHLVGACLFWTLYWVTDLQPLLRANREMEILVGDVPADARADIKRIGIDSMQALPPDFVIVGDETGKMEAGLLAETASKVL